MLSNKYDAQKQCMPSLTHLKIKSENIWWHDELAWPIYHLSSLGARMGSAAWCCWPGPAGNSPAVRTGGWGLRENKGGCPPPHYGKLGCQVSSLPLSHPSKLPLPRCHYCASSQAHLFSASKLMVVKSPGDNHMLIPFESHGSFWAESQIHNWKWLFLSLFFFKLP